MQIAFSLSLTLLRAILVKIRRSNIKRSWPRYLTDLAEILHVVLLWGPNYEMGVSKLSPGKFYFGRSERNMADQRISCHLSVLFTMIFFQSKAP